MLLFDGFNADIIGYRPDNMPASEFIKRNASPEMERVRNELEKWFARYPDTGKHELKAAFLSRNERQHDAAFFELFLHELLLRDGWSVEVHPTIPGHSKTPDFLCKKNGQSCYIEATVATGVSGNDTGRINNYNNTLAKINHEVKSNKFRLTISKNNLSTESIHEGKIAKKIQNWLDGLDHLECMTNKLHPTKNFGPLDVTAIPHESTKKVHDRIIWIFQNTPGDGIINTDNILNKTLKNKADKCGDNLKHPYIIAINYQDILTTFPYDILSSLYGPNGTLSTCPNGDYTTISGRTLNGVFGNSLKPIYTRVSGLFFFHNVSASATLNQCSSFYIPNIFAQKSLTDFSLGLPRMQYDSANCDFVSISGKSLTETLGLNPEWPYLKAQ